MEENKDADYYLEKLKSRGLNRDNYNYSRISSTSKINVFPDEKVFMNWLIAGDYGDLRSASGMLFSVYSNPSSEGDLIINKYIKEENMQKKVSDLLDKCTETELYLLSVLTKLKKYDVDELINIHEKTFNELEKIRDEINSIVSDSLEYFRKKEKEDKKNPYIG
ncbi:hypothetical protein M1112_02580 [Candidatus Parvarchaeota archaeon]|nr:hypothetical protein [Candidatus Parvarchaeota archaeon]